MPFPKRHPWRPTPYAPKAVKKYVQRAIKRHDTVDHFTPFNSVCTATSLAPSTDCAQQVAVELVAPQKYQQRVRLKSGVIFIRPAYQSVCDLRPIKFRVAAIRVQGTEATPRPTPPQLYSLGTDPDADLTDARWMRAPTERYWWPTQVFKWNGYRPTCPTRISGNLGVDGAPIPCEDLEWCTDPDPCEASKQPSDCEDAVQKDQFDYSFTNVPPLRYSVGALVGRKWMRIKEFESVVLCIAWADDTQVQTAPLVKMAGHIIMTAVHDTD